jgi:hypothetical protein
VKEAAMEREVCALDAGQVWVLTSGWTVDQMGRDLGRGGQWETIEYQ